MTVASPSFRSENTRAIPIVREARGRAGRWEFCFELASGGMATVYLAYAGGPMGVGKLAAVKVIQPHLATERGYVDMFLDEARIASMIHHPNVCATYELGRSGESYFIAMEYLAGESLGPLRRALAERAEASVDDRASLAARIVAEAAEGLHAAHELRDLATGKPLEVIHRDVSPQNVFVTYDGAVRVLDFGVARARGRLHHTTPGIVKGKFAYMAPEQMRGLTIDRRADVWSLGVILWELIAGRRLFAENAAATAQIVTRGAISRLVDACPDAPPAIVQIVERALERDPDRRYATAREMSTELGAFLTDAGRSMTMVEVSAWMRSAFAKRAAQKDELVRLAIARGRHAESGTEPEPRTVESLAIQVDREPEEEPPTTPLVAHSSATPHATPTISWRSRSRRTRDSLLLGYAIVFFVCSMVATWISRTRRHVTVAASAPAVAVLPPAPPPASRAMPHVDATAVPIASTPVDAGMEPPPNAHHHRRARPAAPPPTTETPSASPPSETEPTEEPVPEITPAEEPTPPATPH